MSKHRMIQLYEIHEQEKLKCDDKRQIIGYLILGWERNSVGMNLENGMRDPSGVLKILYIQYIYTCIYIYIYV